MKMLMPLVAALLALLILPAAAHQYKVGSIELRHPWTRATPPGAAVAVVYVEIVNKGEEADRLLAVASPLAEAGDIHETKMDGDVMQMRRIEGGLEIPPGATIVLKPGGLHGMLTKLKQSLVQDQTVKATLTFEKAGAIEVELVVEKIGAATSEER